MATIELETKHRDVLKFHNHKLVESSYLRFLHVKVLAGTFNQEKVLVGAL